MTGPQSPLLEVRGLRVSYAVRGAGAGLLRRRSHELHAVRSASFELQPGEAVGVVGESGCGKSTLARAVLRLVAASDGQIVWMGRDLRALDEAAMNACRDQLQIVFQDPLSSHNPRMTIGAIVAEPLEVFQPRSTPEQRARAAEAMLGRVGLGPEFLRRYPHELSGGQCQRVGIARAMISSPRLLVCDEPVSALDVSTRAQILNLLRDVQRETGVAILFISHDLSVVRYLCARVLVMYLGTLVEQGTAAEVFGAPAHPYTQALLASIPVPDPRRPRTRISELIRGELPSPLAPPSGCAFRTRCPHASPICLKSMPPLRTIDAQTHLVACHHAGQLSQAHSP